MEENRKAYLIDLDGTLYRGSEPIPHAAEFLDYLNEHKRRYLLVTNCPEHSPGEIRDKLQSMEIRVELSNILTAGQATAAYLSRIKAGARIYAVGSEALEAELASWGLKLVAEQPEFVVVGFDRKFTYEKMERASYWIRKGARYICTNPDPTVPCRDDLVPHTGALAASIQAASGVTPVYIGKPGKYMLEEALLRLDCHKRTSCIVGDRLDTDVLMGVNHEVASYLVLTGATDRLMVQESHIKPTKVFADLRELRDFEEAGERL